ncbi:girdin-like [Haliotis asinina]|uniref:girdin-like n=1 Tax=Haliotis asinina TaxID=109174 RepID=UPI003531EF4E
MAELTKESQAVQCTETNCNSGSDVLAAIARLTDHHILPEEVHILYDEVTELVQKSCMKDKYIEELNLKLRQLENENKDLRETADIFRQGTGNIRSMGSSGCDDLDRDSRVNRDIIQNLSLKLVIVGNENKELREMYQRVVEKNDMMVGVARQCAHLQELNSQLQKETEKLRWVETLYSQKERELEYSQRKLQKLQQLHNILRGNSQRSIITPKSPMEEEVHPQCEEQTIRPLKRGRFVMEKSCSYECSKCSKFFPTKEVSEESTCCYHHMKPVKAILRREDGTVDPVSPPDWFWPCCQKIGRNAVKCVQNSSHIFIGDGGKR